MWKRMTIDEYAALEKANGERLIEIDGIWWRRIRPFFYQPLFPLLEIVPESTAVPGEAKIGGYQHLVPDPSAANSQRHFLIYDDIPHYSIEMLSRGRRNETRKGLIAFSIRPIQDIEEFISAGHPVYLSFYERTRYNYKKERIDIKLFAEWARRLFAFPKVVILGAYHEGRLSAVDITYLVEDVLFEATFFSDSESLRYRVADAMTHTLRDQAAAFPNIRMIYNGRVTGIRSLDNSKLIRGCKILSKPAFFRLSPAAGIVLKQFMKNSYRKLTGAFDMDRDLDRTIERKDRE